MSKVEMQGVVGITADSRAVRSGYLFAALPGVKVDGRNFIAEAVAKGAIAVLAPEGTAWPPGVPPRRLITAPDPRAKLAELAVEFYGALPERLVAVTGTNGKTSTVDFLRQIFTLAGRKAASVGTLGVIAPGHDPSGSLTTPDPVTLAKTLTGLAREGVNDVAMEASSHGLDQHRLDGLRFCAAGFTNLTRDHLDYHGSMDAYGAAKLRLFTALLKRGGAARVMADLAPEILSQLRERAAACEQSFELVSVDRVKPRPDGQLVQVNGKAVELHLPGRFQADNAALAASLAEAAGVSDALASLPHLAGVRGRLERALVLPNGAAAYVDYAHTPDAIARVLAALRPHATGRLHIVFGAGGDRDPGKRPLMGEAAMIGADVVIITDDNPRSEDPAPIRRAILTACPGAVEIADRRAAIAAALDGLREGDVLVVAGKGHEQGQIVKGEVIPFDDALVIRELGGAP
ncbi:UDP-N-acetylmuramoylalanyl-D-glutamate--2, 6-diaminopimelate ligase [Acidocella aminolytica 101 = DSM 11237]|uniref:UDP-N-acetylmuramoyl-L-alanyl-D-glutamate--2, 6-diaminopimelate ligase n=1 Tax=Acidocella aminolytica TaxID=33998 RepID=UPI0021567185|nr:UDP-N-acetylmuramoyl-L-alanyl-D-glutamate--2,6-diaminopimelate ligase [Acidocella aminolytica]GBQ40767.1 UDP-N-acetylmuramoylalanyl-D-glutamate--2, 6-diaminopimelate ligase [Acidocella aminolytica 101 = DSM 11237]